MKIGRIEVICDRLSMKTAKSWDKMMNRESSYDITTALIG